MPADPGSLAFSPPASYAFEPELQGPVPRPIPELLHRGPYATKRRDGVRALIRFGVGALLLDLVPGVDALSLYVLPLAYLTWIGFGALALAALAWLDARLRLGPFRYVRHGAPIAARVIELVKAPSHVVNGQPSLYAYTAAIAVTNPETAVPQRVELRSDAFPAAQRGEYDTPFRIGDTVTAVYFPGRYEKSLRLYAFLGLHPEISVRRRAAAAMPRWQVALGALALAALVVLLSGNVYGLARYQPLAFSFEQVAWPAAAGALLFGGAGFVGLLRAHRAEERRTRERNERAGAGEAVELGVPFGGTGVHGHVTRVLIALGLPLIGGVTALYWTFLANAWLDESPARLHPARVTAMTMTTHALLFRQYSLTYVLDGSDETHELWSTPQELMRFEQDRAIAHVRAGRFGWPWVESVLPAEIEAGG